jgi:hypothetical protein
LLFQLPKNAYFLTNSALCSASEFGKLIVMITKSKAVILFQQQRYSMASLMEGRINSTPITLAGKKHRQSVGGPI